jgi:hypothetical protein
MVWILTHKRYEEFLMVWILTHNNLIFKMFFLKKFSFRDIAQQQRIKEL